MKPGLLKYKIGLFVLLIFTALLVVFVTSEAGKAKDDLKTREAATKVADQLNAYVSQSGVPSSLSAAHIKDVPSAVKYTKLSSTKYRFCVTYKAASSGFNPDTAFQDAVTGYYMSRAGGSYSASGYLYLDSAHKKGENCQEITAQQTQPSFPDYYLNQDPSTSTPSISCTDLSNCSPTTNPYLDLSNPSYQYPVQ